MHVSASQFHSATFEILGEYQRYIIHCRLHSFCLVRLILRSLNANASDLFSFFSSNSCLCSYKSFDTFPPLTIVCHVMNHFKASDIQNTVLNNRVFILFTYLQELLNTGIFTIGYGITTLFQLINWASVNSYGRTSNIIAAVSLIVSHVFIFPCEANDLEYSFPN